MQYGCSHNWHRGTVACPNNGRILRSEIEARVLGALKDRVLNPDIIHVLAKKVNEKLKKGSDQHQSDARTIKNEITGVEREIDNIVKYIAESSDASIAVQSALQEREARLKELKALEFRTSSQEPVPKIEAEPGNIAKWLRYVREMMASDPIRARREIAPLIGTLKAEPVVRDGKKGMELVDKPRLDGVLGVIGGIATS